jgi:protein-tyrosine-phosphatase
MPYSKLIFVDADGTCRSAMCKILMKSKPLPAALDIEARGLVVLFPEPLDAKAYAVLQNRGYDVQNCQAQPLEQEDIGDDVLLLTMEDRQKFKIWEQFENARHVYTLAEFIRWSGDILPLYGEPVESYDEWVAIMERLLDELVLRLKDEIVPPETEDTQQEQPENGDDARNEEETENDGQENGLSDLG